MLRNSRTLRILKACNSRDKDDYSEGIISNTTNESVQLNSCAVSSQNEDTEDIPTDITEPLASCYLLPKNVFIESMEICENFDNVFSNVDIEYFTEDGLNIATSALLEGNVISNEIGQSEEKGVDEEENVEMVEPETDAEIVEEDNEHLKMLEQENDPSANIESNLNNLGDLNDNSHTPGKENSDLSDSESESEKEKVWSVKMRRERKQNRNLGKNYTTVKGKIREARNCKPLKTCRQKCKERLTETQRHTIFKNYWALGSYDKRVSFVSNLIKVQQKKIERIKDELRKHKNRQKTFYYHFEVDNFNIPVCKACFLSTLDESGKFILSVVNKKSASLIGTPENDKRGKHRPHNKLSAQAIEMVKTHIMSFPAYESHYTRRHTTKKYLQTNLNLNIMYDLYREKEENPVSKSVYRQEFKKTNLKFKKPALDTCGTCDSLKVAANSSAEAIRIEAEDKLRLHHEEADLAYRTKKYDKELSKTREDMRIFTFDLQQVLPTPLLTSGEVFYKRQLSVYNLTIHDCTTGKSVHYMWHEAIGKRGSTEIASCLYKTLLSMPPEIKHVIFYSDTCGGQNKNSNVISMFTYVLNSHPTLEAIEHKFLIPGHTHMECDSDHSLIERKSKRSPFPIYHPRDWYQLVRIAGKKNFKVVVMEQADILDFSDLFKKYLSKKKTDVNKNNFNFRNLKWLSFTKTFGIFKYKNTLKIDEEFQVMSFQKKTNASISKKYAIPKAYNAIIPISALKKENLLSLLGQVDADVREFYTNLPTEEHSADFDPDLDRLEENEGIE